MNYFVKQLMLLTLVISISISIIGCSDETESSARTTNSSPLLASPLDSPLSLPQDVVAPTVPPRGPDFRIDQSVQSGDILVHGTGPAGVNIKIVDVSWGGEIMGTGTIDTDGTFAIEVTPVEAGNRIAIMLENTGSSGLSYQDFQNNEHYQDLPMVGLLLYYLDVPAQ
jgi:hypothetical protein